MSEEYTKLQQQYEYLRKVAMTYMYTDKAQYDAYMVGVEALKQQMFTLANGV